MSIEAGLQYTNLKLFFVEKIFVTWDVTGVCPQV